MSPSLTQVIINLNSLERYEATQTVPRLLAVLRTMTALFFPTYQRSVALYTLHGKLPVVVL